MLARINAPLTTDNPACLRLWLFNNLWTDAAGVYRARRLPDRRTAIPLATPSKIQRYTCLPRHVSLEFSACRVSSRTFLLVVYVSPWCPDVPFTFHSEIVLAQVCARVAAPILWFNIALEHSGAKLPNWAPKQTSGPTISIIGALHSFARNRTSGPTISIRGIHSGGGGALTSQLGRGCRWGMGWKPDPVSNRSAHQKYTLSQYTLLKNFHMHTLWEGERVSRSSVDSRFVGILVRTYGLSILLCVIIHS